MDDDSDSPTDSPPARPRPTRHVPPRQAKLKIKTPARETRATAAYFTNSSNTTNNSAASSTETDNTPLTRNLRPLREKRKPVTTPAASVPAKAVKRQRVQPAANGTPILLRRYHARSKSAAADDALSSPASTSPPWHTLPYHVWLRVFDFVAVPIRDPTSRIDDLAEAVGTLLSGARTCRSTAEPALAALYWCPPFNRTYNKSPHASFLHFLQILARPPSQTFIHYRPKVKILQIDVDTLLTKKVSGLQLQLKQVLKNTPQLVRLELYHPSDEPPYRDLDFNLRWKISKDDLLEGLGFLPDGDSSAGDKMSPTILQSWRWNSRLAPIDLTLDRLSDIHALPSFRSLRKVAFVNYQLPSTTQFSARARESQEALDRDLQAIAHLSASISALPNLKHLVIESSTLANGSLLERLPKTLAHLELVNCWEITSEDLSVFLMSHGNSLVRLTLKHCQSLSLGFLPVLGTSCPNLAHLEVDLSYFRHHESYADNKPEYATLLEEDQIPTWPSSIQSIEIINMRNWTREAAEMFFGSLMQNAKALPNLRRLEFKVILNIEWRQRQEMRQSLADQMTRVFKRKSSPPGERRTLRQPNGKKWKDADEIDTSRPTVRRSSRSTGSVATKKKSSSSTKRQAAQTLPVRRSLRSLKPISTFDADDEESSEDELSLAEAGTRQSRLDNQRPAERQYDMDDFLDSQDRSETEWNSDEDDVFA
ncbi:hypothetical protein ONZ43_g4368 [Nemania bipapillata]|uniref:Uncharacterized protein n=1 Tax=Nemania bipapillata TaxID=110536 RepID=A0ACC2INN9_9PEZI|nr:hypothetical protein ONZ43_g4368 [Nemania bipapillata]